MDTEKRCLLDVDSSAGKENIMSTSFSAGLSVGFAIVCLVLLVWACRRKKAGQLSHYDERQKQIQAKGNYIGYMTMIGMSVAVMFILESGKKVLFSPGMWVLMTIMVSCLTGIIYTIVRGAYIEYDKKGNTQLLLFALLGAANVLSAVAQGTHGHLFVHGVITVASGANLICGMYFLVMFLAVLIRKFTDKRESEEE
jgi:Na+-translocating ferredoxin:NAD+ oxidoreductase RnfA subunit